MPDCLTEPPLSTVTNTSAAAACSRLQPSCLPPAAHLAADVSLKAVLAAEGPGGVKGANHLVRGEVITRPPATREGERSAGAANKRERRPGFQGIRGKHFPEKSWGAPAAAKRVSAPPSSAKVRPILPPSPAASAFAPLPPRSAQERRRGPDAKRLPPLLLLDGGARQPPSSCRPF